MKTALRALALFVAAGSLSCGSVVARRPTGRAVIANPAAADEIIQSYYEAIGGYRRLKAVQTRHLHGEYIEGHLRAMTEIFQQRPQLRRVNLYTPAFDHFEGFDGQTWEYHRDSGKVVGHLVRDAARGAADLAQRRGSEFDESFVDYKARGFEAIFLGTQRVGTSDSYRIRIVRTDGWTLEYYFDVRTHLLTALRKAMPLHAEGRDVESFTFYSRWRVVSGLLVPFVGEERNVKTGALMNSLRWDVIEHNVPIASVDILPPSA